MAGEECDVTVINSCYNFLWRRKSVKQDHMPEGFWWLDVVSQISDLQNQRDAS